MFGFQLPLGEVMVEKFAKVKEAATVRICPQCGAYPTTQEFKRSHPDLWKPEGLGYSSGYNCKCGFTANHWSRLKEIVAGTGEAVVRSKLTPGDGKTPEAAKVLVMPATEFAEKYADGTLDEHGVIAKDANTANNLRKLLTATERLGKVIIVRFNDVDTQRIALLALNMSNRVILREIIPINLAEISETLKVDVSAITETDVNEATALLTQLPLATQQDLMVSDYRTIGLTEGPIESPKVQSLKEIIAQMGQSAIAPTNP